jgi:hypothetical protein
LLANCVHDLAQEVLIGDLLGRRGTEALSALSLELLDLDRGELPELRVQGLARLQLLAVDEEVRGRGRG